MKILFYSEVWHHLQNLEPVIRNLEKKHVGYRILILSQQYDDFEQVKGLFDENCFDYYYENRVYRILRQFAFFNAVHKLVRLPLLWFWLIMCFLRYRPCRLVLSEDRTLVSSIVISAAHRCGVKCILEPKESLFWVESVMDNKANQGHILPDMTHRSWIQRIAAKLYPANIKFYKSQWIYSYTPLHVMIAFLLRQLPKSPWLSGGNHIDVIAVNSQAQLEENVRYGLDDTCQVVTGFPMHDRLVSYLNHRENLKQEIADRLGLQVQKRICLILGTIPEHLWKGDDLATVNKMQQHLLAFLHERLSANFEIVFKLHPREHRAEFIEKMALPLANPVKFTKHEYSAYELLAVSDLVIMFKSSTVMAALALDVPILACGIHNLPGFSNYYKHFASVEQLTTIESIHTFTYTLHDSNYLNTMRQKRLHDRMRFGMFDGNSTERFVNLLLQ